MKATARRLLLLISVAALVLAIWLLAESRPPLPSTDRLGTAPAADRLLVFLAWLGCLLLALGLLYRLAAHVRRNSTAPPVPMRHLHPRRPTTRVQSTSGYPDRAFPLIPRSVAGFAERAAVEPTPTDGGEGSVMEPRSGTDDGSQQAKISLLGPLTISGGRRRARRLRGPTRELLCYLAFHPAGAQRDQIIDALWPEQAPEKGRDRLWRAAGDVRSHFGDTVLGRDGDRYQLDRTEIAIDLDRLESLLAELERAGQPENQLPLLEQALALFRGEPLTGVDFPWAESDQRHLHAVHLDLLERAGRALVATGDPAAALAHAESGLGFEPYNEKLARVAMEAESELGLRGAVINRYEQLSKLLQQQLGLQPQRETRMLYRELLGQDQHEERRAPAPSR